MRRMSALVCAAACVLVVSTSTAKGAGGRIDGLLASRGACPTGYLHHAPVSVQLGAMVCLIQFVRAREGLRPLRRSAKLEQVAGLKVDADLACDEFSHTPCGQAFMTWFEAVGYGLGSAQYAVAENLAWGSGRNASPRRIMRMWLHSAEHRRNLVSPKWREFGLGLRPQVAFLGSDSVELWASEFGSP
jgi:hypothetical protein